MAQFWVGLTTWVTVLTDGAASATAVHSLRIASMSASVSREEPPQPVRTPPCVTEPGKTISMLLPMLAICFWIELSAPLPTASMAITAATPMMMPRAVRRGAHEVAPQRLQRNDGDLAEIDHDSPRSGRARQQAAPRHRTMIATSRPRRRWSRPRTPHGAAAGRAALPRVEPGVTNGSTARQSRPPIASSTSVAGYPHRSIASPCHRAEYQITTLSSAM